MPSPGPQALRRLRHLNTSSSDFHDRLCNVLYGEEYQRCVQNLQGDDLVWLVGYLDKALDGLDPSSRASRKCLRELRSVCGTRMILPTSCIIPPHLPTIDLEPFACGGFGDVYHGTLDGSRVCIKRVRMYTEDGPQKATKIFCEEAVMWKRLTHPNVLPLLGITIDPLQLISDWMPGGDLLKYVKEHNNTDRLRLLSDVTKGLCYLHRCNMIHGDLKAQNVLVDESGRARIADLGLATVTQNLDSVRSTSIQQGYSPRWTAPEVLDGAKLTKEADIFSFAMIVIEVFTGAVPFSDSTSMMAMLFITEEKRPPRPALPSFTPDLWTLTQRCWSHDPLSRPKISEIVTQLLTLSIHDRLIGRAPAAHKRISPIVTVFLGNGQVEAIQRLSQDDTQILIDVVDQVLDDDGLPPEIRRKYLPNLYGACGRRALLPGSLKIPLCYDPNEIPLRHDEFGDVWKGRHNGREVAAKVLRVYSTSDFEKIIKRFCKEVVWWRSLRHPNVLPLLGVTMSKDQFVMVSDWLENGSIEEFVKGHTNVDRLGLLRDAARGLIYMHDRGLVHGNLRGPNVLIDNNGHARLANFGLLTIVSDNPTMASTAVGATLAYWMSPELLVPEMFDLKESRPTKASDCYALGMMVYEILSGETPFSHHPPVMVVLRVLEGERPERPQGAQGALFTNAIWAVLECCWKPQPCDRIGAKAVLRGLEGNSPLSEPTARVVGAVGVEADDQSDAASSDPQLTDWTL